MAMGERVGTLDGWVAGAIYGDAVEPIGASVGELGENVVGASFGDDVDTTGDRDGAFLGVSVKAIGFCVGTLVG
jgi:hypothetical protein